MSRRRTLALATRIRIVGVAPHSMDRDGIVETQALGITKLPAHVEMGHMQRIEAVVPTRTEYRNGKAKTPSGTAERAVLMTQPATGHSTATAWATATTFYLRDPALFKKALGEFSDATGSWICAARSAVDFSLLAGVLGLEQLQRVSALPFWPVLTSGGQAKIQATGTYERERNEASHLFWAAVGMQDKQSYTAAQIANFVMTLAAAMRDDSSGLAASLAVALGLVNELPIDRNGINARVARIDERTLAYYGGQEIVRGRNVYPEAEARGASASGPYFPVRQSILKAIFIDERDRTFMFGTDSRGANPGLYQETYNVVPNTATGRLIAMQLQASKRLGASLADAFFHQQEFDMGVVTQPSQQGQFYHAFRAPRFG